VGFNDPRTKEGIRMTRTDEQERILADVRRKLAEKNNTVIGETQPDPGSEPFALNSSVEAGLRGGDAFARGIGDAVGDFAGAGPEVFSWLGRQVPGVRDYMPEAGYFPKKLKEIGGAVGEAISYPVNRALGYANPDGTPVGTREQTDMEKVLSGTGYGVGSAASFLAPLGLLSRAAVPGTTTQNIAKVMTAQPGVQLTAGGVGGAVTEATDNPWVGLAAALGTGVGASMALSKIAQHGATTTADKKILHLIREIGGGDEAAGFAAVRKQLAIGGDDTALVDTLGIGGEKIARAAANVPEGKAPSMADEFVDTRVGARGARLQTSADELAPNRMYSFLDDLSQQRRMDAKPLYDEAFAPRSDLDGKMFAPWDDRLQQFLDEPLIKRGMAKGIEVQRLEALADEIPFNYQEYAIKGFDDAGELIIDQTPNLRAMDAAKRGLDEIIEEARDTFGNINWTPHLNAINRVRKKLVTKLDDITRDESGRSAYQEARGVWAGPSSLRDAANLGRKFLKGDEELTAKMIAAMSEGEKEAFRIGARREISRIINDDTQTALTKFAGKKATFWNKLRLLFPDEKSFDDYAASIERELGKGKVERFMGPRAGSQTTGLKEDIAGLSRLPETASRGLEAAGQFIAAPWNPVKPLAILARPAVDWAKRPNAKTAQRLAEYLFELSPAKQQTMLQALQGGSQKKAHDLSMVQSLLGAITAEQTPYDEIGARF
jgi:hypothetical protein